MAPDTTSIYLQGIDSEEIIAAFHARCASMMSATAGLRLLRSARDGRSGSAAPAVLAAFAHTGESERPARTCRDSPRCSAVFDAGVIRSVLVR